MRKLLSQLWEDDGGFIISLELLFVAVILVIGIIAGMGNLRIAMIVGLTQLANAIMAIDPGFEISGISGDSAGSEGSQATMVAPAANFTFASPIQEPGLVFKDPVNTTIINPGLPYQAVP